MEMAAGGMILPANLPLLNWILVIDICKWLIRRRPIHYDDNLHHRYMMTTFEVRLCQVSGLQPSLGRFSSP